MNQEYKLTLKKIFGHLSVVNKHRFKVFSLCCKAGIPIRGILHDLSKYSPEEFIESARYFGEGKFSPIRTCKQTKGYSNAWILIKIIISIIMNTGMIMRLQSKVQLCH